MKHGDTPSETQIFLMGIECSQVSLLTGLNKEARVQVEINAAKNYIIHDLFPKNWNGFDTDFY